MPNSSIELEVSGGQIQGVAGAGIVHIENFTIYNRPAKEQVAIGSEAIPPCPYPGLACFGHEDADLFFGRDVAIARLTEVVKCKSFTVLAGASGSGKSSVVLAGLAPNLHRSGSWRFSQFRIGTELDHDPFMALARALVPLYVESDSDTERLKNTKELAASLRAGELSLRDVFAGCRNHNKARRILLIADQFEEAFTLVANESLRHQFIDILLAGSLDPAPGSTPDISLIMTLRADFYGQALLYRPFADALQGHVENLGPMKRDELKQAIVRPAENEKVFFDPGLVETLLDAVENKPGSLPLLQFALREIWKRQEKRTITRKTYDAIGGVEGALAQRAEAIFATLTQNGANLETDKAFQRLFTRLVTLGEGQEDTRRVVERRELGDEAWSLAQRLADEDNRLVVTNAPSGSSETAEVVHEALIRHWPQLLAWIHRDRDFHKWLRKIKPNIDAWSANPADEDTLLRGRMLNEAKDWHDKQRNELCEAELRFIEASIAAKQREIEASIAAKQREKRKKRHKRALIYMALGSTIVVLVGWINRSFINDEINWVFFGRPYMRTQVQPYVLADLNLRPGQTFRECGKACPEMVVVAAGKFMMGSPKNEPGHYKNEEPQHPVVIDRPFAVSKFEVTFADWDACVSVGGCPQDDRAFDRGWGRGEQPVIYVSWDDAKAYVTWLSKMTGKEYRLLTEAEYEYATRAGNSYVYYWGDDIGKKNTVCGECGNSDWDNKHPAPVGSFKANALGLHDMLGNVWEWVQDCYHSDYEGAPANGSAWTTGDCVDRGVRGGSWDDNAPDLRSADRYRFGAGVRDSHVGFRVARTILVPDVTYDLQAYDFD